MFRKNVFFFTNRHFDRSKAERKNHRLLFLHLLLVRDFSTSFHFVTFRSK